MKIAIDVNPIIKNKKTGVGSGEYWMVKEILTQFSDNEYILNYFSLGKTEEILRKLEILYANGAKSSNCSWFNEFMYRVIGNILPIPYSIFFGKEVDLTHFHDFIIPYGVHGKKIVTIHDMVYMTYSETMRFRTKVMMKLSIKKSCKRADAIITDSEFTKQEIIRFLNINPQKIFVIPLGVDTIFFHPIDDIILINQTIKKYSIEKNYFLYIGTLDPRKNIERLIKSYNLLLKKYFTIPKLVIAGWGGWAYKSILKLIEELNLKENIILTGYVSDEDIVPLICGAFAFVFPSLYEGFGLPPLEAMACGIPVLASNASSLPEVVGDAALLVNPLDIDDIFINLEKLLSNEMLRQDLSKKGLERSKQFTWARTAKLTMDVYNQVIQDNNKL